MYDAARKCKCRMQNANDMPTHTSKSRRVSQATHAFSLNGHALVQLVNRIPTDIDVLGEQLVRHLVFLQNVVVGARAREGGAEEEAEHSSSESTDGFPHGTGAGDRVVQAGRGLECSRGTEGEGGCLAESAH